MLKFATRGGWLASEADLGVVMQLHHYRTWGQFGKSQTTNHRRHEALRRNHCELSCRLTFSGKLGHPEDLSAGENLGNPLRVGRSAID